jgi:hypothetical protein
MNTKASFFFESVCRLREKHAFLAVEALLAGRALTQLLHGATIV